MNKKKILVTGSDGFIGKHLVSALKGRGFSVYKFDKSQGYDICRKDSFSSFLDKKIGTVFHLAGKTYVPDSWDQADVFYKVNTLGTQQVLEFCKETKAKLVYLSAYVYGAAQYLPIDENHAVDPSNPYSHSKLLAEQICRLYAEVMGVRVTVLRPFNIFGPGQRDCFLIPMILKQIREQGRITVKDSAPRRDYLYIDDLIDACLLAMKNLKGYRLFNVGSGAAFSVEEIIEIICRHYKRDIPWKSLKQARKNEIPETVANYRLINCELKWKPKINFKDGIKMTIEAG